MILSKVIGTVVATRKDERLVSNKLLIVQPFDPSGGMRGNQLVAVDKVDENVSFFVEETDNLYFLEQN